MALGDKIREIEGVKAVARSNTSERVIRGRGYLRHRPHDLRRELPGALSGTRAKVFRDPMRFSWTTFTRAPKASAREIRLTFLGIRSRLRGSWSTATATAVHTFGNRSVNGRRGEPRLALLYKTIHPDRLNDVIDRMNKIFPTYRILPMKEYTMLMMSNNMAALDAFIRVVVFISVLIGVLVIFLRCTPRSRSGRGEIGILRSLGASKSFIVSLIFQETVAVCLVGVILGVAASFLIARGVSVMFPTLLVMITTVWVVKASSFAVLSGLIGSLYPSLKAAAQDPVEAIAYE